MGVLIIFRSTDMGKNVGGIDRIIRIVAGVVLIALAVTNTVGLWGYIGVVPLLTGLLGWCPPYAIFGFNTCRIKN
jgi:uncharacterized membrane protein YqaE (UPF0057 family)